MMNLSSPSDVTGEPVVRVLDPGDFFTVLESGQSIEKKRIYLSEYDRYAEETIICLLYTSSWWRNSAMPC